TATAWPTSSALPPAKRRQLRIKCGRSRHDIRWHRALWKRGELCAHRVDLTISSITVLHALDHRHCELVLCSQRRHYRLTLTNARIISDDERLRVRLTVDNQFHGVCARQRQWSMRRRRDRTRRRIHLIIDVGIESRWIVIAKIPIDAIHAGFGRQGTLRRRHKPVIRIRKSNGHWRL